MTHNKPLAAHSPFGLMTPEQLSEALHISVGTLANWRYRNEGPAWHSLGSRVAYRIEDVERWLKTCRISTSHAA